MKILLQGGSVADGENMTVRRADVLVADGKIAAVGEELSSDGAEVLDCTGLIVTAGYTDAHVHVESGMVLPEAFGDAVLPFGTTAIIADPHEVVNVAGGAQSLFEGVRPRPHRHFRLSAIRGAGNAFGHQRRREVHRGRHDALPFSSPRGGAG